MAKKDKLDKDKEERLEKLLKEWEKSGEKLGHFPSSEKLTVLDLRLLLENPSPLRELIRQIVAAEMGANSTAQSSEAGIELAASATYTEDIQALQDADQALEEHRDKPTQARTELAQARINLKQTQTELEQLKQAAQQTQVDLKTCSAQVEKLLKNEDRYKQDIKAREEELQQLQAELAAAQTDSSAEPALVFLRSDPQLAQIMGLADLPADNTQALIQTVAVLAQIDNLKRLWEALKDRCEAGKRTVTDNECALLQAALDWHNHNWHRLPYRLIDVATASRFDYETQSRSRHVTKGETVAAMQLPGIADGNGKVLCKALVQTK